MSVHYLSSRGPLPPHAPSDNVRRLHLIGDRNRTGPALIMLERRPVSFVPAERGFWARLVGWGRG